MAIQRHVSIIRFSSLNTSKKNIKTYYVIISNWFSVEQMPSAPHKPKLHTRRATTLVATYDLGQVPADGTRSFSVGEMNNVITIHSDQFLRILQLVSSLLRLLRQGYRTNLSHWTAALTPACRTGGKCS